MSIHLVGGGWSADDAGEVYREFLGEAAARAALVGRATPRVAVVLVREDEADLERARTEFIGLLARVAPVEPVPVLLLEGQQLDSRALGGIDGLLIGGGLTPAYLDAVEPVAGEIRLLVGDGLPYLGFSAGAMIAAERAIIGGWQIGGVPVCAEECGEDLDEVTVVEGLALVDIAVDVHAAQWGTLSRLVAATEAGLVDGGVAVDEHTALIVGEGQLRVVGRGSVWRVLDADDGVLVSTLGG